jgi:hypothetical protein
MRRRRHTSRLRQGLFGLLLVAAVGFGFVTTQAFTASNTVPATTISQTTQSITPLQLEPAACISTSIGGGYSGFNVTSIVAGSGTVTATAAYQLVLGSSGNDTLSDPNTYGNDCLVGGAGTDSISGWKHHDDLCIPSNATQSGGTVTNCGVVAVQP